ncbi:hypothetical protein [Hyphomicrobium sp.]|uniref:hypothetical protein n=1 Tax=Hyphomicrobium sp. TaxID=82 RepID=UPI001D8C8D0E|nr:hypothetical protein [Hyphomicrobium sp.]MBY0559869.1 hypothetical protein [Hyphomicrobium sp.]
MPGAARRSNDTAAGPQIGANQTFVYVEGELWMVLGDVNAAHGPAPHVPGPDLMVEGSSFVFIDGIPICREGHLAGCGHPTTGSSVVFSED